MTDIPTGPLADLGAEVIKIERVPGGDDTRRMTPPEIDGEGPGRAPVKIGSPVCDYNAGILTALGIVSAYVHRPKTGQGQFVDTSLFEAGISATFHQSAMYFASGVTPEPLGSGHPLSAPYQAYETSDGWITVGAGNQANWARLCGALGAAELIDDSRFITNDDRMANLDTMNSALDPLFAAHTTDALMDALEQAGVPAEPVLDIAEMSQDPQAIARDMTPEVTHARLGQRRTLGSRSNFPAPRPTCDPARPRWVSTRPRSCAGWAMPIPTSTGSPKTAR